MIKVDVISGFLGAGKTTLIKKLLSDALSNQKVVLIENEFGEIGIDGGFLKESGIEIKEINSGCICCSLVGDFSTSLKEVITKYEPERIIIEPSGVGKLSDVIKAIENVSDELNVYVNSATTVVDALKVKMYMKNFGEFFNNQIEAASTIILTRVDKADDTHINDALELVKSKTEATIITTPIDDLGGVKILEVMEKNHEDLAKELAHHEHHHHHDGECCCGHDHDDDDDDDECECHHEGEHHHHHHDGECCCGHDHEDDDDDECECHHEGEHHHHHHDGECCCGHDHDDDDDDECECHHEGEHHHHHHDGECCCGHDHGEGHHHADEVFESFGIEKAMKISRDELVYILDKLSSSEEYGMILRSKGMIQAKEGSTWYYFDLVPGEYEIREGKPDYTSRLCVIGSKLNKDLLEALFEAR